MSDTNHERDEKLKDIFRNFKDESGSKSGTPPHGELYNTYEYPFGPYITGLSEERHEIYTITNSADGIKKHIATVYWKLHGLVINDFGDTFIRIEKNHIFLNLNFEDTIREIKKLEITGSHREKIAEFFNAYFHDPKNIEGAVKYHADKIYLENGTVKVDSDEKYDSINVLLTLKSIENISAAPENFKIVMAYSLFAPLSYFIRQQGHFVPYLISTGSAGAGKTSTQKLFVIKGYDRLPNDGHIAMNDIKTPYTLMKFWNKSILPSSVEEVSLDWLQFHSELLKANANSVNAGSRGHFQAVDVYESRAQLMFDTNDTIDGTLSQLDRFIICDYPAEARSRQNIEEYEKLVEKLPSGFMFALFDAVFGGKKLKEIISDIYKVKNRNDVKKAIIEYTLNKINDISKDIKFGIPDLENIKTENNGSDWIAEVYNTTSYIAQSLDSVERMNTYEINKSQVDKDSDKVFISRAGFALLRRHIPGIPFKSVNELSNAAFSKFYLAKITSHRFNNSSDHPLLCVSIEPFTAKSENDELISKLNELKSVRTMLIKNNLPVESSLTSKIRELEDKINHGNESEKQPPEDGKGENANTDKDSQEKQSTSDGQEEKEEPKSDANSDSKKTDKPQEPSTSSKEAANASIPIDPAQLQSIKIKILDFCSHGKPSNELSNIARMLKFDYNIEAEQAANIIKSMISENMIVLDEYKRHILLKEHFRILYFATQTTDYQAAIDSVNGKLMDSYKHLDWTYLKIQAQTYGSNEWRSFVMHSREVSEKEFITMKGGKNE